MTTTAETERALVSALHTIRTYWAALMVPSGSGGVASKPQPKALYTRPDDDERDDDLPPTDRRIALRHDVTLCLMGWAKVVVEDRDLTHHLPLGTDTLGLIVLLERHARWFSGHEAAEDAVAEIRTWAGRVQAAAAPQRREWMPIGTCPLEVEQQDIGELEDGTPYSRGVGPCAGQVRAYPGHDPRCQKCGTEADVTWWERVMFPDAELSELVTADDLVLVLHRAFGGAPVKPSTIRQWIARGVIAATGQKDDKGRSLYDRAAVIYAVARRQEAKA